MLILTSSLDFRVTVSHSDSIYKQFCHPWILVSEVRHWLHLGGKQRLNCFEVCYLIKPLHSTV